MADTAHPKEAFTYERNPLDFYTEPRWCVDLLLDAEKYLGKVWDPACGNGTIGRAFAARSHAILSTDVAARPYADSFGNFLDDDWVDIRVDHIVCNPPFGQAEDFIRQGLRLAGRSAAFLLPLKWLASDARQRFFAEVGKPARVYVMADRASMPPGNYLDPVTGLFAIDDPNPKKVVDADGKPVIDPETGEQELSHRFHVGDAPKGGAIDYCWVVFVPGYSGPTDLRWLSKANLKGTSAGRPRPPPEARKAALQARAGKGAEA